MPPLEELLQPKRIRYPIHDEIKEARGADEPGPQGGWARVLKTANFAEVERIATEALIHKGKDLQVAAWTTEGATLSISRRTRYCSS